MRVSRWRRFAIVIALAVPVALVTGSASATPDAPWRENEYYSEKQVKLTAPDWMRWLPDTVHLSELSIPGTRSGFRAAAVGAYRLNKISGI